MTTVTEAAREVREIFEEFKTKQSEAAHRIDEIEQKMASRGPSGTFGIDRGPTWGEQVTARIGEAKGYFETRSSKGSMSFELKTTMTTAADSGGSFGTPYRDTALIMPQRPLAVRDLIPNVPITSGSFEYPKQTTRTNAAATVAEGAEKPESALAFEMVTGTPKVIAHWIPASRQILDDAPQLRAIIDTELLYGLAYVEDNQLLNGGGTGQDLNGVYTQATAFSAGSLVIDNPTKVDAIAAAILQQGLANLPATGIVLNPSDWMEMLMLKDNEGRYLVGQPQDNALPRLWGLPVVQTAAMTAGNFLVGDFRTSATIYDRWTPRVEISTEHDDFFVRNLVAILCEQRIGLAVKRTTGFTKGAFDTAITALAGG